jgi:hypothetical protein
MWGVEHGISIISGPQREERRRRREEEQARF